MTLLEIVQEMEQLALLSPAVKMVVPNNIFDLNNKPDAEYGVFGWTQGTHTLAQDRNTITYQFTIMYVDRLISDESNRLFAQTTGIEVLSNIIRALPVVNSPQFTTFHQRFADECTGVMATINVIGTTQTTCAE